MRPLLKAITFDLWNTLYKAPPDNNLSEMRASKISQVLGEMGLDSDLETIRRVFLDCWQYAHRYQLESGLDITPRGHVDFIVHKLQLHLSRENWQRVYDVYTSILLDYPPELNDGVKDTLPVLAAKYKLAVICNTGMSPGTVIREIMKADDIFRFFELEVFSDEVLWAKPNVKIFSYTLEKLGIENCQAAHVGDDWSTDVTGAKRAGMLSVWLAPEEQDKVTGTDFQIRTIAELNGLFEEYSRQEDQ